MSLKKREIISYYEDHSFFDANFPIIYHLDTCRIASPFSNYMHWHENIEVLYFIDGEGIVYLGAEEVHAKKGDMVIVNANILHGFDSVTETCQYHCLIVDKSLYDSFGIQASKMFFSDIINDGTARECFDKIVAEWNGEKEFCKASIKLSALQLLLHLCRNHLDSNVPVPTVNDKRTETVKSAIGYIRTHFNKEITIEDICSHIGFSKYYFCRIFKEVTHRTPVEYINFVRCHNARNLILSGKYNVSESAELSGFKNLSYFSKTYKKIFGTLPSKKV